MISDHERRVLDGIEQELRATDPDLCERLGRIEPAPGPVRRAVVRLISTKAIAGWLVALGVALLLERPGLAMALFVVVIAALSLRVSRMEADLPGPPMPPPPFGLPPYWPR